MPDGPYAMVREGGEVDGTQYYIVSVKEETGEHASAPLDEDGLRKLIEESKNLLPDES